MLIKNAEGVYIIIISMSRTLKEQINFAKPQFF